MPAQQYSTRWKATAAHGFVMVMLDMDLDPRWRTIARLADVAHGDVVRLVIRLYNIAYRNCGQVDDVDTDFLSDALDLPVDRIDAILQVMHEKGVIGADGRFADWQKLYGRQPSTTPEAERQRRCRARRKVAQSTVPNGVTERDIERDIAPIERETDKEETPPRGKPPSHNVVDLFEGVVPPDWVEEARRQRKALGLLPVDDAFVIAKFRNRKGHGRGNFLNFYLDEKVRAPSRAGSQALIHQQPHDGPVDPSLILREALDYRRRGGDWYLRDLYIDPHYSDSDVPIELLVEFGFRPSAAA